MIDDAYLLNSITLEIWVERAPVEKKSIPFARKCFSPLECLSGWKQNVKRHNNDVKTMLRHWNSDCPEIMKKIIRMNVRSYEERRKIRTIFFIRTRDSYFSLEKKKKKKKKKRFEL